MYVKFFLLIAIIPTLGFAKKDVDVLTKVQEKYKALPSFSADIQQEIYQEALARVKSSKGAIQLQKPSKIRWEIYEPDPNILVSNGRKLWYYTPPLDPKGKGQAIERPVTNLTKQPLYRILSGQISFANDFSLESESGSEDKRLLVLKPKKSLGETEALEVTLNKAFEITEIFLKNKGGNTTRIRLQNTKLGGNLPHNIFDFKPPPGTDIVKE